MPPPGGYRTSLSYAISGGQAWNQAFQPSQGLFSPGTPLVPVDPQPVRRFEFRPAVNTILQPRQHEPFGFAHLRSFANVELVRLAVETRKDQVEACGWNIVTKVGRKPRADTPERIRKIERFWNKPDGETPFASWLRMAMEDLLVLDAPAFEMRRTRGGQLTGLDVVAGDTIKVLVDQNGRRPKYPVPAYQQVLYGRPWIDLTTKDVLYVPRNRRPHKMYGYGPVEQIVVTINTALQRQASQLFHFGVSNQPPGILTAPEGWTADQIKEFQTWFDDMLSGNLVEKSKLIWTPFGTTYKAFKDPPIKDEFDEWLARIVCYCFSLPPTAFVQQNNRATAVQADQTALQEGREPLLLWWKRIADSIIADELDCPDLEWVWERQDAIDPHRQAQIDEINLKVGKATINELRRRDGYRDALPGGDVARIYTQTGAIELTASDDMQEARIEGARAAINGDMGGPTPIAPKPSAKPQPKPTPKPKPSGPAKG